MRFARNLHFKRHVVLATWGVALILGASLAPAVERVYTIVPQESSISISGSVMSDVGTSQIQPQGPGGLTTNYTGTIRTDRVSNSIQFLPGSAIDASVSGNWQPLSTGAAGSAAADYGGRVSYLFGLVTINFAARDFLGDLSSKVLPLDEDGDFGLASTDVSFLNGSLAYRTSTGDAGSESVIGESGPMSGTGSLTTETRTEGIFEILSIPINSSFTIPVEDGTTVSLQLSGELVAAAMLPDDQSGDFNQDGFVDAADYVVWRNGLGTTYTQADYELWRAEFGQAGASMALTSPNSLLTAVPEPATVLILAAAMFVILSCGRSIAT